MEQEKVHPDALAQMLKAYPNSRWAAYQNVALDSSNLGHLQFLAIGPENTYKEPPIRYPMDTAHGMGWRYWLHGWVDLKTGEIQTEELKCRICGGDIPRGTYHASSSPPHICSVNCEMNEAGELDPKKGDRG